MRRSFSTTTNRAALALLAVAALALAGCSACDTQQASLAAVAPRAAAAGPACAPCAGPVAAAAPGPLTIVAASGTYQVEAPIGVRYTVGPNEVGRAAIAIPANVVACWTDGAAKGLVLLGDTLRCTANNLWPNPQPTATLIYRSPAAAAQARAADGACGLPPQP